MNTLLAPPCAQLDPGLTDSDIVAIVEDFLRTQIDPGTRTLQADPGDHMKRQVDPGSQLDPGIQVDPGTVEMPPQIDAGNQLDPGDQVDPSIQVDPGVKITAQCDPGQ